MVVVWLLGNKPPFNKPLCWSVGKKIRTEKTILNGMLMVLPKQSNNGSFLTLIMEVVAIINSRTLTINSPDNVNSDPALSPSNILTIKSIVLLPLPGSGE